MSDWIPDLSRYPGPRYRAIADAIAQDIESGRLNRGARLPTHRDLAYHLKVTVGTVTRAYSEAEKRGLIGGEVGRGTFVRGRTEYPANSPSPEGLIDLSINVPRGNNTQESEALAATLADIARSGTLGELTGYQPHFGMPEHRAALAALIERPGVEAPADRIVLTAGAQHAIMTALSAVVAPGDTIACESVTFGGLKAAARLMHLRLKGLAMDEQGLIPEAFEAACREGSIKALYAVPTLQNPTGIIWPDRRRDDICAIAERYGVTILEDDVYGFLVPEAPLPLVARLPQQVYHLTSTSKSLAPGLRIGCLLAPREAMTRLATGIRTTIWMAPPLMAEIVRRWVHDGTASRLMAQKRSEGIRRQTAARSILARHGIRVQDRHPASFHLWLPLSEAIHDEELVAAARREGVLIAGTSNFLIGRVLAEGIRLALGTPETLTEVERGVEIVARLMSSGEACNRDCDVI
jgi:DNA-binding transcriptional MocR family regulator